MITGSGSKYLQRAKTERSGLQRAATSPRRRRKSSGNPVHRRFKGREGKRASEPCIRGLNRIQSNPEGRNVRRGPASARPVKRRQFRKIRAIGGASSLDSDIDPEKTVAAQYKQALESIYRKKARSKLHSLDSLLSKYEHKEHVLYLNVCGKYEITPDRRLLMLDDVRTKLKAIFQNHDLSRYDEVDTLLAVHHGNEYKLYESLCEEYNAEKEEKLYTQKEIEAAKQPPPKKKSKLTPSLSSSDITEPAPASMITESLFFTDLTFHSFLTDLYGRHNRDMLSSINSLIRNYRGRETELYLKICRKYNIAPKPMTQNVLSSKRMNFAIGEYVETRIANVSEDTWVLSLITDIKTSDSTYDLTVIDPGEYQVVPDATHVAEKNIRKRQYHTDDIVETRIVYGTNKQDLWIPARIKKQNDDETYNLSVPGYKKWKVNPEAVFVPTQFIRPILTTQMLAQIPPLKRGVCLEATETKATFETQKAVETKRMVGPKEVEDFEENVKAVANAVVQSSQNVTETQKKTESGGLETLATNEKAPIMNFPTEDLVPGGPLIE